MQARPSPGTQLDRPNLIHQDSRLGEKTTQTGCCAGSLFDSVLKKQ